MMIRFLLSDQGRLVMLVSCCAALWSLESVMPLYRYRGRGPRRAFPNIALTVLLILTNLALSFAAASAAKFAVSNRIGLMFVAPMPRWIAVLLGIAALDFFAYVGHIALHKSRLGWRFHRVHHSDQEVDVTTAFRQHPGESVWRVLCQLPAIVLFGVPLWVVVIYLTISAANAQLEHANLRLPEVLDRAFRLFFVTPNMHKVHHSRFLPETDSNYANIFSVWDRLFMTYTGHVDFDRLTYGLDDVEPGDVNRLRKLLAMPFITRF